MRPLIKAIKKHTNHWDRTSDDRLILWFSGYKCKEYLEACEDLRTHQVKFKDSGFDKISGKTYLIIEEK